MSLAFQERFKNRANIIGKQGVIEVENSAAIEKPGKNQVFVQKKNKEKDLPPVDYDFDSVYS
jgi:hypothetical protein